MFEYSLSVWKYLNVATTVKAENQPKPATCLNSSDSKIRISRSPRIEVGVTTAKSNDYHRETRKTAAKQNPTEQNPPEKQNPPVARHRCPVTSVSAPSSALRVSDLTPRRWRTTDVQSKAEKTPRTRSPCSPRRISAPPGKRGAQPRPRPPTAPLSSVKAEAEPGQEYYKDEGFDLSEEQVDMQVDMLLGRVDVAAAFDEQRGSDETVYKVEEVKAEALPLTSSHFVKYRVHEGKHIKTWQCAICELGLFIGSEARAGRGF